MRSLRERVRWVLVPIAAYLAITVGLPAANGAVRHAAFFHHALLVLAGCAAVLVVAAAGGLVVERFQRKGGPS